MTKCFHCNGYYGPSFGQPVCSTCHMFLYPDDSSLHSSSVHHHDFKVEDGDSGNEEPREPNECSATLDPGGSTLDPHSSSLEPSAPLEELNGLCIEDSSPEPLDSNQELPLVGINFSEPGTSHAFLNTGGEESDDSLPYEDGNWSNMVGCFDDLSPCSMASDNQTVTIHNLPPEVILLIFRSLDEISLWSVGQVSRRWQQLINNCNLQWRVFIQRRWPLFNAIYNVTNWHAVFTNLVDSAPCQLCLFRMPYNTLPQPEEDSWRKKRLSNERRSLRTDPPEGISAYALDKNCLRWQASIRGPAGSPYQGATFFLYIQIPSDYPLSPPLVRFITRIFHPNVSRHGDIGIDSIQHNWSVAITISKVLVSIQSLLTDPYTKVCMEPRIGEMYDDNRALFERIARAWTWCYAMHDAIDPDSIVPGFMHRLTSDHYNSGKVFEKNETSEEKDVINYEQTV